MLGLPKELQERLDAACLAYAKEVSEVTKELLSGCESQDDMEMAMAILHISIEKSAEKAQHEIDTKK